MNDPVAARAGVDLDRDDKLVPAHAARGREPRAPAVRQQVALAGGVPRAREPVGVGVEEQPAEQIRRPAAPPPARGAAGSRLSSCCAVRAAARRPAASVPASALPVARKRSSASRRSARSHVAGDRLRAAAPPGRARRGRRAAPPGCTRAPRRRPTRRAEHEARQARVQRQARHGPAGGGRRPRGVEGAEVDEQRARRRQPGGGRRVEPRERVRSRAPQIASSSASEARSATSTSGGANAVSAS